MGNEAGYWPKAHVATFLSPNFPILPNVGVWLKPKKWNQGGYDAIFIDPSQNLIHFAQVTRGDKHSFKIQYFASFLGALASLNQSFEIKSLEFFFVVQQDKLASFKIAEFSGMHLLGGKKGKRRIW